MKRFRAKKSAKVIPFSKEDHAVEPVDTYRISSIPACTALPLVQACIEEVKLKGLDGPFLFRPFRPGSSTHPVKSLIRKYLTKPSPDVKGFAAEFKLLEPLEIISAFRWICSRIEGGLLSYEQYTLFDKYEEQVDRESKSYKSLVDILFEDSAKRCIFYAFLDLLTMIAARESNNGHAPLKLAKEASILLFNCSRSDHMNFKQAYAAWTAGAYATQHFLLGYMRATMEESASGIALIPPSLHHFLNNEQYPPRKHSSLGHVKALKLKINVTQLSSSPSNLLQRSLAHAPRIDNAVLQTMADSKTHHGISEECYRLIRSIEAVNSQHAERMASDASDAEWLAFHNHGFEAASIRYRLDAGQHASKQNRARPKTPNWSQFMQSGFAQYGDAPLAPILPMHLHLPSIPKCPSDTHFSASSDIGTLAEVNSIKIDSTVAEAWLMSLAGEMSDHVKGYFGRCLIVEAHESKDLLIIEEVLQNLSDTSPRKTKNGCKPFDLFRPKRKLKKESEKDIERSVAAPGFQDFKLVEAQLQALVLKWKQSVPKDRDVVVKTPGSPRVDTGVSNDELTTDMSLAVAWSVAYDEKSSPVNESEALDEAPLELGTSTDEYVTYEEHIEGPVKTASDSPSGAGAHDDDTDVVQCSSNAVKHVIGSIGTFPTRAARKPSLKNKFLCRLKSIRHKAPMPLDDGHFLDSWDADRPGTDDMIKKPGSAQQALHSECTIEQSPKQDLLNDLEDASDSINDESSCHASTKSSLASSNVSTVLLPDQDVKLEPIGVQSEPEQNCMEERAGFSCEPVRIIAAQAKLQPANGRRQSQRTYAQSSVPKASQIRESLVYPKSLMRPHVAIDTDARQKAPRSLSYAHSYRRHGFDPRARQESVSKSNTEETMDERLTRIQNKVAQLMT